MEDKQPTPANNSQDKTAKGTDDEETAEVGVDVRIMIDEETRDLIGMKNDEGPDGVENRAVGNKRGKMGHQIEVTDHSQDRGPPSGEGSPAHTPPPKDQDKGRLQRNLTRAPTRRILRTKSTTSSWGKCV